MGELMRTMDWSKSTLGDPINWPQSLRIAVSICLNFRFPLIIWWSSDLIMIYNDSYRELIAAKHPKAMGAKGADIWPEIWHIVGPMLEGVLQTGEATWSEDQPLTTERNGYPEESFFTFSYSTIRDETDNIGGVFCAVQETTKRVLTERNLTKQVNNLLIQAPVAICIFRGPQYIVELANENMLRLWDRTLDQVINKPVFECMPDLGGQGFEELLDNVYKTGIRFVTSEVPLTLLRNGKSEDVFIKLTYEAVRDEDGIISGVMAVADEITEQVHSRQKAEDTNKRYYRMLMESPFAFTVMKGHDMIITLANDLMKSFWGKGADVEGKSLLEILPEIRNQAFPGMIRNVLTTSIPLYLNETLARLTHNGITGDYYYNITYQPHYEADETVSGVICIAYDVTEMVLTRKKVEESEKRFRNLVDKAPSPICILKGEDMVLEVANEPVFKVWNVGKEALGKPFLDIIPEMKGQPFMVYLLDVYHNGVTLHGNEEPAYFTRKDGTKETIYFNFVYQPYHEDDGTISGVMVLATDVTEQVTSRKKIEESEHRYQEMIFSSPSLIAILKGEEMIIDIANDAILETWGKGKNVVGKPLLTALPELVGHGFDDLFHNVYSSGKPHFAYEMPVYFLRNGQKELSYYTFTYQAQRDTEGNINGVAVIGREVTPEA